MDEENLREVFGINSAPESEPEREEPQPIHVQPPLPQRLILGMTAPQRFAVALMLLVVVFVLGSFLLILTNKIALPF